MSFKALRGRRSASGVFVLEDFRDNLIIDRYDPIFAGMRASKLDGLSNFKGVGMLTWADTASALMGCTGPDASPLEQAVSAQALVWLKAKGIQP